MFWNTNGVAKSIKIETGPTELATPPKLQVTHEKIEINKKAYTY
jgi:hypothetical protein